VVRNFPTAQMLIGGAFELQKEIFKASGMTPKTAVLLCINDTFGTAMIGGIKAMFPKLGMPYELVDTISYDAAAKDLSVEVAKAKATKADMLMPVCRLNDAKLMIQEMVKQRWEPMIVMNPGSPGTLRAGFPQDHGQVRRVPYLRRAVARSEVGDDHVAREASSREVPERPARPQRRLHLRGHADRRARMARRQVDQADALMDALRKVKIDQHVMIGGPIQFDAKGQNVNIKMAARAEPQALSRPS
jgi:branched-chain amino acid transport system substrate-binding protein